MTATSEPFEHQRPNHGGGAQPARRVTLVEDPVPGVVPVVIDGFDELLLDRIADRLASMVALRLEDPARVQPERLVDAREIARTTGRSRAWVYEHAGDLGAVRLGSGSRPRLGFSPSRVATYLQAAGEPRKPVAPVRRRPNRRQHRGRTVRGVELLPIGGHDA